MMLRLLDPSGYRERCGTPYLYFRGVTIPQYSTIRQPIASGIALAIAVMACASATAQLPEMPPDAQPGHCYEKCFLPAVIAADTAEYIAYTGRQPQSEVPWRPEGLTTRVPRVEWVTDPQTGIRCLKETAPAEVTRVLLLSDTAATADFERRTYITERLVRPAGVDVWKEVVCRSNQTPQLAYEVSAALARGGFLPAADSTISPALHEGLRAYQSDRGLALGTFTVETLRHLGITPPIKREAPSDSGRKSRKRKTRRKG